jgi:hypothetical protein
MDDVSPVAETKTNEGSLSNRPFNLMAFHFLTANCDAHSGNILTSKINGQAIAIDNGSAFAPDKGYRYPSCHYYKEFLKRGPAFFVSSPEFMEALKQKFSDALIDTKYRKILAIDSPDTSKSSQRKLLDSKIQRIKENRDILLSIAGNPQYNPLAREKGYSIREANIQALEGIPLTKSSDFEFLQTNKSVTGPDAQREIVIIPWIRDFDFAKEKGLIYENVSVSQLPREKSYTFLMTESGNIRFGQTENGWEVGTKHWHLAQNESSKGAGELQIDDQGNIEFNLLSGTYTRQLSKEIQNKLKDKLQLFFSRQVPRAIVTFHKDALIPERTVPSNQTIREMCAEGSLFLKAPLIAGRDEFCKRSDILKAIQMAVGTQKDGARERLEANQSVD